MLPASPRNTQAFGRHKVLKLNIKKLITHAENTMIIGCVSVAPHREFAIPNPSSPINARLALNPSNPSHMFMALMTPIQAKTVKGTAKKPRYNIEPLG